MPRTSKDDSAERVAHARRTKGYLSYDLAKIKETSKRQRLLRIGKNAIERLPPAFEDGFETEEAIADLGGEIYDYAQDSEDAPTYAEIQTECYERFDGADDYNMRARVRYYDAIVQWLSREELLNIVRTMDNPADEHHPTDLEV